MREIWWSYLIKPVQIFCVSQEDVGLETVLVVGINTSPYSTVWSEREGGREGGREGARKERGRKRGRKVRREGGREGEREGEFKTKQGYE